MLVSETYFIFSVTWQFGDKGKCLVSFSLVGVVDVTLPDVVLGMYRVSPLADDLHIVVIHDNAGQ